MAAPLSRYEQQALLAYQWAETTCPQKYQNLPPRNFHRTSPKECMVEAYCSAEGIPVIDWKKGNSGRNLTTIVCNLEKHGVRLDAGHVIFEQPAKPDAASPPAPQKSATIVSPKSQVTSTPPQLAYAATTVNPAITPEASMTDTRKASYTSPPADVANLLQYWNSSPPVNSEPVAASAIPSTTDTAADALSANAPSQSAVPPQEAMTRAKRREEGRRNRRLRKEANLHDELRKLHDDNARFASIVSKGGLMPTTPTKLNANINKSNIEELEAEEDRQLRAALEASMKQIGPEDYLPITPPISRQNTGDTTEPTLSRKNSTRKKSIPKKALSKGSSATAHFAPRTPASTNPDSPFNAKSEPSASMAPCPVCGVPFPMAKIDSHLDACLSEQALNEMTSKDPSLVSSNNEIIQKASSSTSASNTPSASKKRPSADLETLEDALMPQQKKAASSVQQQTKGPAAVINLDSDDSNGAVRMDEDDHNSGGNDDDEDDDEDYAFYKRLPRRRWYMDRDDIDSDEDDEDEDEDRDKKPSLFSSPPRPVATVSAPVTSVASPSIARVASTAVAASPKPVPAAPNLYIPNSGGLFNIRQFSTDSDKECPICFEEFRAGDNGILLTCLCLYHHKCISDWLEVKPRNCPSHGQF